MLDKSKSHTITKDGMTIVARYITRDNHPIKQVRKYGNGWSISSRYHQVNNQPEKEITDSTGEKLCFHKCINKLIIYK